MPITYPEDADLNSYDGGFMIVWITIMIVTQEI
jgi:hypothetical protein